MRHQDRYSCDVQVTFDHLGANRTELIAIDVAAKAVSHAANIAGDVIHEQYADKKIASFEVVGVQKRDRIYQDW